MRTPPGFYQYGARSFDVLKVKYSEVSEEGVPRFPVGEGTRVPEDMSV